jgi:MFS family permease
MNDFNAATMDPTSVAGDDPQKLIDQAPMSKLQIVAVTLAVILNGLDGLDQQAISFVAPLIKREWSTTMVALGVVLSIDVVGMAMGAMLLGALADRIGRRRVMLICLCCMTLGTVLSAMASNIGQLGLTRIITGFGVGGMVVVINTAVAELSNLRRRSLCVSLMVVGYSVGAVIGGAAITLLLKSGEWRSTFYMCGAINFVVIPLVWAYMPESPGFLSRRGGASALLRVNAVLAKMGLPALASLRRVVSREGRPPAELTGMRRSIAGRVALLTVCFFGQLSTSYFLGKWIVKIVVDMGYTVVQAGSVLVISSIGSIVGGVMFGLAMQRFALRPLTISCMVLNFTFVALFGFGSDHLAFLMLMALGAGAMAYGCLVGIYAIMASTFPHEVRGTASGLVMGIGRGGAVFSPILAGALMQAHFATWQVTSCLATGSLLAATMLLFSGRREVSPTTQGGRPELVV